MVSYCVPANTAVICARISEEPHFSHEAYGERYYSFSAECERRSGRCDVIPCLVSEKFLPKLSSKDKILLLGQIRSCNRVVEGKTRLLINMFVKNVSETVFDDTHNEVILQGYLCKTPSYRKTPFGREITDILLAVNRPFGRSDYIPVIAWGSNARIAAKLDVGSKLHIEGRIQSRDYEKHLESGEVFIRTAYEVSAFILRQLY